MAARGRGGGKTPERVVAFLNEEVAKHGQNATAREIGLSLYSLHRYLKGIGEPTQATFEKLAAYFGVTVAWLRGEAIENAIITAAFIAHDMETRGFVLDENIILGIFDSLTHMEKHNTNEIRNHPELKAKIEKIREHGNKCGGLLYTA